VRRLGTVALVLVAARVTLAFVPRAPLSTRVPGSTAVAAADGTLLRLTLAADGQYRLWTPLDEISPRLAEATLLYEDRHFRRHPGVNPVALARAAFATYVTGERRVGGSTITMQLARRLWSIPSSSAWGKLRQIGRALQLEALHSKREILEAYLNLAPYGGNIEGAGAAAEIHFRKRPSALTLGEALTLAVIPQSPTRRARDALDPPSAAPSKLNLARAALLAAWTEEHPGVEPPVRVWPQLRRSDDLPFLAPHLVDEVLAESPPAGRLATTLDLSLQRLVERHLRAYVGRQRRRGIQNAAAMLVDGRTGGVRALVGSADFFDARILGQVNGTLAARSPGSALKPFAYGLALDQGVIHPATMLRDVPTAFAAYSPENFDGRFAGPLSATLALVRSRNVPALAVTAPLNRPSLYDLLKTSGVALPHPERHYGLGLVLGTGEVTMHDLVRLYAALGSGGVIRPLALVKASEAASPEGIRILSPESAFLVADMLEQNPRPSARVVAGAGDASPLPVAWKTGTSWRFRDAWSVGLVGPYVLAVWVGEFSGESNPAFVGAQAAAPLFFEIVDSVAAAAPRIVAAARAARPAPPGVSRVEVCALSGGLPTAHCPHRKRSWFIPGRSPVAPCEIHRGLALDAQGRRTCASGPPAARSEVYEVWPSDLARLFAAAGLPRRPLPPAAPGCDDEEAPRGAPPRITSPLGGVTYNLRSGADTLALQAVTDGDAALVYWFVDEAFVGRAARGTTLFWRPEAGGRFTVRAVDDLGRSDARPVAVEALR
jgi:penicillin-binding protein 1C